MAKKGDRSPSPVDSAAEEEEEVYEVEKITGHKVCLGSSRRPVGQRFNVRLVIRIPSTISNELAMNFVSGLVDVTRFMRSTRSAQ